MIDHKHDCLCCSPFVGEPFRAAQSHTGIDDAVDVGEVANMLLGKIVDRRTVLKTCAALAGAAATVSVLPPSALAQPAGVTVFRNGTVLTADKAFSEAEAVAFRDERILAVGSVAEVTRQAGQEAKIVDLEGHTLLPGFIDPHTHMLSGALVASLMEYVGSLNSPRPTTS
jgi:hypothetical protein